MQTPLARILAPAEGDPRGVRIAYAPDQGPIDPDADLGEDWLPPGTMVAREHMLAGGSLRCIRILEGPLAGRRGVVPDDSLRPMFQDR
ncbi:MAG: hypothetical protein U0800_13415 [Isosphaeraceae bacterium]